MTIEELLKPRIKVIAPMPLMKNKVGDFLKCIIDGNGVSFGIHAVDNCIHFYDIEEFKQWPYIFKELEWWKERKVGDMPAYLKDVISGKIYKVSEYIYSESQICSDFATIDGWNMLYDCMPATEQEYNTYLQTLNK